MGSGVGDQVEASWTDRTAKKNGFDDLEGKHNSDTAAFI